MFDAADLPEASRFRGFMPDTFAFLAELSVYNSRTWMHAHEERYRRVLRDPLRMLFHALVPVMRRLSPEFETEIKRGRVMGAINRRWFEDAHPYHDHLWGAFYRQGYTKQTDLQFLVRVDCDGVRAGLMLDTNASEAWSVLQAIFVPSGNTTLQDSFLALLQGARNDGLLLNIDDQALHDAALLPGVITNARTFSLLRLFPMQEESTYAPSLADEISTIFERLFPLATMLGGEQQVQHATNNPESASNSAVDALPVIHVATPVTLEDIASRTYLDIHILHTLEQLLEDKRQVLLVGPPGTGKTYLAREFARYWATGEIRTVQFHPNYAYEEFIEGIRPVLAAGGSVSYQVVPGLLRQLATRAEKYPDQRFVLIVDEFNRGDLNRVFGELLYTLEYRAESVLLPYSGEAFALPPNIYLIGTMNTADKSPAALDYALRRRFPAITLATDPEILRRWLVDHHPELSYLADGLIRLNAMLSADGIEPARHIGQSFFISTHLTSARARLIFEHNICPILEEYFYDRPEAGSRYTFDSVFHSPARHSPE